MSSNDTLISAMMAEMDVLQKNHLALEEHEAYEESKWAEDLVAEKKAKLEEQQRALKIAEENLETANKTYNRIRYVPRAQRRGVNFKTETTLHDRLSIREKWETLNWLLKTVGKEERKLEYLDRPWRLEKTDVPQAQVQKVQPEKVETEKVETEKVKTEKVETEKVETPQLPESESEPESEPKPDNNYAPPPRVLDAEQYWPASRCRNLAKEVLREKLSRNHFGLIQQLSSHYKITPEEFKRTNPFDLLKDTGILRKILNYREYSRMERARRMVI